MSCAMGLTHGFGIMGDLLGPPKTNSGIGKKPNRKLTFKEKTALTVVVLNIGLIIVALGLLGKVISIWERRTDAWKKKFSKDKQPVIIDVEVVEKEDKCQKMNK